MVQMKYPVYAVMNDAKLVYSETSQVKVCLHLLNGYFILTDKINRTVFFEVPIAEIENTLDRFGRNTAGRFIETGAEKYQVRYNKRQCDDIEFMSAF